MHDDDDDVVNGVICRKSHLVASGSIFLADVKVCIDISKGKIMVEMHAICFENYGLC